MRSRRVVPAGQARSAWRTSREISAEAVGSATNGGALLVSLWTSERVASVTPTAIAAAAIAAAPTTNQTRSRGLTGTTVSANNVRELPRVCHPVAGQDECAGQARALFKAASRAAPQ